MIHTPETGSRTPEQDVPPAVSASPPGPLRSKVSRKWSFSPLFLIPSLLGLAGMLLFLYPSIFVRIVQHNQSQLIAGYEGETERADPSANEQPKLAARYNDALSVGVALGANTNVPTGEGTSDDRGLDYNLIPTANETGLMARSKAPTANIDLPIYHGTTDDTLFMGLGHLEGTSLPVGGAGHRMVTTGHRGPAEACMLTDPDKANIGSTFIFEVFGEVLSYRVFDGKVIEPEETEALCAESGYDLATLVTCIPLGINTQRILITGERIYPMLQKDLDAVGATPEIPGLPWWAVGLLGGVVLIGGYIWRSGYSSSSRKCAR